MVLHYSDSFAPQVYLYHNAVGSGAPHEVSVIKDTVNPGSSRVEDAIPKGSSAAKSHDGGGGERTTTVLLDDLFDGAEDRPRHPFFDRPVGPQDIAAIKVRRSAEASNLASG